MKISIKDIISDLDNILKSQDINLRNTLRTPLELQSIKQKIRFDLKFLPEGKLRLKIDTSKLNFTNELDRQYIFLYKGAKKHWVSLKAHKLVRDWAIRNNVIREENGKFYWNQYRDKKQTTGIRVGFKSQRLYITKAHKDAYVKIVEFLIDYLKRNG